MTAWSDVPNSDLPAGTAVYWTIVGGLGSQSATLASGNDADYLKAPAGRQPGIVNFQQNTTQIPAGAVITGVDVVARVSKGSVNPSPAGMAPQITFALERTGYQQIAAFTRTIFPTSATPQNFTVGSFTKSAGRTAVPWDVQELNLAQAKFYVNNAGVADTARLYSVALNVNYRTAPLVAVNTPTGNVFTPAPLISWTYTQTDGDAQSAAAWALFTAAQVNTPGFDPSAAAPIQSGSVTGDIAQTMMNSALPVGSYYVYVMVTSAYGASSSWTGRSFAISAPSPGVPGVDGGSGPIISVSADAVSGAATLTLRDNSNRLPVSMADAEIYGEGAEFTTLNCLVARDATNAFNDGVTSAQGSWQVSANIPNAAANMLTANQAGMETDASAWLAGSNTTLVTDATHPHAGTKDVKITSTAAGNIQATSNFKIAIASGGEYTITMWVYSTVAGRTGYLQAEAFDAATGTVDNGSLGQGAPTTLTQNGFTQLSITVAGINAYQVQINLVISASAGAQSYFFDDVSMTQTTRMQVGTGYVEISGSETLTCSAQLLAIATSRSTQVSVTYFDANFAPLGVTTLGTAVGDATATWTTGQVLDTTPAAAVYCQMLVQWSGVVNGELHNMDRLGVMYGTNTPWSDGGQAGRNLLSAWYSTSEDTAQPGEAWTPNAATSLAVVDNPLVIGRKQQKMTYNGLSPTIALRGVGTVYTRGNTNGTTYTLNKPAATAVGDLMLAFVTANFDTVALTPPAGWTVFDQVAVANGGFHSTMWVLARTATSSEPATWTDGGFSANTSDTVAAVASYSGAAALSNQLVDHAVSSLGSLQNYETTGTVNNTDPNAWLVSAFLAADNATGGSWAGASTAPPTPQPISYVGTSAGSVGTGTFVINKPSGVQNGDFMIVSVAVYGSNASVAAPSGWTVVDQANDGLNDAHLAILTRTAGSSEPSSWSGTFTYSSLNATRASSLNCVAYRGAAGTFGAHSINWTASSGTSFTSSTISITDSRQWSLGVFVGSSDVNTGTGYVPGRTWTGAEAVIRENQSPGSSLTDTQLTHTYFDSGAGQPTGSDTNTAHFADGGSFKSAVSWIATLNAATSAIGTAQTSRASGTAGTTSDNVLAVFDSNGVVPLGPQSVTGHYVRSTSQFQLALGWAGLIRPANFNVAGSMAVTSATQFDLSNITDDAWNRCGGQMTFSCVIFGSTGGLPQFTLTFYRANQPIQVVNAVATPFNSSSSSLCGFTFTAPPEATSVGIGIAAFNRSVGDTINFDHPGLVLGAVAGYQAGTNRQYHPIWSYPEIQYAEDRGLGYGSWQELAGVGTLAPSYDYYTGNATFADHTIVPLVTRKYRARTVSIGQAGDMAASPWSPESAPVTITGQNWWLKDIADPANNLQLKVKWDTFSTTRTNTATSWQPLGEDFPVMLTEGFKSEKFTVSLVPVDQTDFAALEVMLEGGKILYLQTDIDRAWWVRPEDDLKTDLLPTNRRRTNPLRAIQQTFLEMSASEAPE